MSTSPEGSSLSAPSEAGPKPRRRWRWLFLAAVLLVLATPLIFWIATYLFLNTPLGPGLLNRPGGRTTLDWKAGHSWIPGQVHVERFSLEGVTPVGRWRLEVDRADLEHQLAPFFRRAFVVDSVKARGASFSWVRHDEPVELPPRRFKKRPGWLLSFPSLEIEGIRRLVFDDNTVDSAAKPGRASGAFELQIRGETEVPHFELHLEQAVLDRSQEALARLEHFALKGRLDAFSPKEHRGAAALRFLSGDVELKTEAWNLSSLSNFFRGLPVEVDGRGKLDAHLQVKRGILEPTSQLNVDDGQFDIRYLNYRAKGQGHLRLSGDAPAADAGGGGTSQSTLTATLETYTFGNMGESPHLEGENLTLKGSGPPLDLADPDPQFIAELSVPDARVPDFTAFDDAIPAGVPLRLESGRGRMDLELRLDPETTRISGQVAIRGEDIRARIEGQEISGALNLSAQLDQGEIDTKQFHLSHLSLDVDDVAAAGLSDWWARLQISGGELTLDRPLQVSGDASAVLSDARPLAALLIDHRRTVTWLNRIIDEKSVRASTHVQLREQALALTGLSVSSGSRLRGHGDLHMAHDGITGLLLLEYGRLAAAAELLPGGEKDFKVRRARQWFESRLAAEQASQSDP